MPEDQPNRNGNPRLDRMERWMQTFQDEQLKLQNGLSSLLESQTQITIQMGQLIGVVQGFAKALEQVVGIMQDIATAQRRMEHELVELKDSIHELREAQTHTDERLIALIGFIEGVVRRPTVQ